MNVCTGCGQQKGLIKSRAENGCCNNIHDMWDTKYTASILSTGICVTDHLPRQLLYKNAAACTFLPSENEYEYNCNIPHVTDLHSSYKGCEICLTNMDVL